MFKSFISCIHCYFREIHNSLYTYKRTYQKVFCIVNLDAPTFVKTKVKTQFLISKTTEFDVLVCFTYLNNSTNGIMEESLLLFGNNSHFQ